MYEKWFVEEKKENQKKREPKSLGLEPKIMIWKKRVAHGRDNGSMNPNSDRSIDRVA